MRTWVSLVSAFALALALPAPSASAVAAYDDQDCADQTVTWTNDPCAGRQWGIENIQAPQAWTRTRGAGAVVAVVDTGVDFNHPDLSANLIRPSGSNLLKNTAYRCPFQKTPKRAKSSQALAQDDNGHGTHVAGIVAAVSGNSDGVASVAPAASVLPVKVLDAQGNGSDGDVARGICFAVDRGADVVNLSLGFDPATSIVVTGLGNDTDDAIKYAHGRGVAVVIAAGNESFPACDFPASHSMALCVGAVDSGDLKAAYSNFGQRIDVVAPGGAGTVFCEDDLDVWSTILPSSDFDCSDNGYETLGGTSMASPHAAGVAALVVASRGGSVSPDTLYGVIRGSSDDLGAPGQDPVYGHGRVNARRAVGA